MLTDSPKANFQEVKCFSKHGSRPCSRPSCKAHPGSCPVKSWTRWSIRVLSASEIPDFLPEILQMNIYPTRNISGFPKKELWPRPCPSGTAHPGSRPVRSWTRWSIRVLSASETPKFVPETVYMDNFWENISCKDSQRMGCDLVHFPLYEPSGISSSENLVCGYFQRQKCQNLYQKSLK